MSALQVIALRLSEDVRQAAVLKLTGVQVHENWDTAVLGLQKAQAFLTSSLQARSRAELPYSILAQLIATVLIEDSVSVTNRMLLPFVWARSFGRAYDVASNSRVVADFKRIRRAGGIPEELVTTDLTIEDLVQAGRQGGKALSAALMLLVRSEFAQSGDVGVSDELTPIPLFPSEYESDAPGLSPPSSRVLGLAVMPRAEVQMLHKLGLPNLLNDFFGRDELLRANFLPSGDVLKRLLRNGEWRAVLEFRARAIAEALMARGVIFRDLP